MPANWHLEDETTAARACLFSPAPLFALAERERVFYQVYYAREVALAGSGRGGARGVDRKRKNSISGRGCALRRSFGVGVLREMAREMARDFGAGVDEREAWITGKVGREADSAWLEKVAEKGEGVGMGRKGRNCATAHRNNRFKKGLYEAYFQEVAAMLEVREMLRGGGVDVDVRGLDGSEVDVEEGSKVEAVVEVERAPETAPAQVDWRFGVCDGGETGVRAGATADSSEDAQGTSEEGGFEGAFEMGSAEAFSAWIEEEGGCAAGGIMALLGDAFPGELDTSPAAPAC